MKNPMNPSGDVASGLLGGSVEFPSRTGRGSYTPVESIDLEIGDKKSITLASMINYPEQEEFSRKKCLKYIGEYLFQVLEESAGRRADKDDMMREYKRVLSLDAPDRESPLGEDGANIRTPYTWEAYQSLHAFLLEAIGGAEPIIKVEPYDGTNTDVAAKQESHYDAYYRAIRIKNTLDKLLCYIFEDGTGFIKVEWMRDVRRVWDVAIIDDTNYVQFGYRKIAESADLTAYEKPATKSKPKEIVYKGDVVSGPRELLLWDSPIWTPVTLYDVLISPADIKDIDRASVVGHRMTVSIDELRQGARAGLYDSEALSLLEGLSPVAITQDFPTNFNLGGVEPDSDEDIGGSSGEDAYINRSSQRRVEIVESYIRADLDGDDLEEDWVVTIETSRKVVLRAQRHIYGAGKKPIRPVIAYRRGDLLYGQSLPKILAGLQEEADATVNMALDGGSLANTIIVSKNRTSRTSFDQNGFHTGINIIESDYDAEKAFRAQRLTEGVSNDIYPNIDLIRSLFANTTAISEVAAGSSSSGATATETRSLLVAAARRLKTMITRVQESVAEAAWITEHMMKMYYLMRSGGEMDMPIPIPTMAGHATIPSSMTLAEFMYPTRKFPLGDGIVTDAALKMQSAEKLWMMTERNPLMQGSTKMHAAASYVLRAFGVREPSAYIGTLEEARSQEEQAAEAKENDPLANFEIPSGIDPKLNQEMFALALSRLDPETMQQVLGIIDQLKQTGEVPDNSAGEEMAKIEVEKIKAQHQIELQKIKAESDIEAERLRSETAMKLAEIQYNADMALRAKDEELKKKDSEIEDAKEKAAKAKESKADKD